MKRLLKNQKDKLLGIASADVDAPGVSQSGDIFTAVIQSACLYYYTVVDPCRSFFFPPDLTSFTWFKGSRLQVSSLKPVGAAIST